jgi:hypothetical protein
MIFFEETQSFKFTKDCLQVIYEFIFFQKILGLDNIKKETIKY